MFEELQAEEKGQKEERKKLIKITAYILGVLVIVGAIIYAVSGARSKAPQPAQAPAAAAPRQTKPDAVKDLQIVRATMGKDPSGIRVMWSVQVRNKSAVYTYSDIQYEATFLRVDGRTLAVDRGTIKDSVGPGEEKRIMPFVDGIYDASASTYQFVLTGATSSEK